MRIGMRMLSFFCLVLQTENVHFYVKPDTWSNATRPDSNALSNYMCPDTGGSFVCPDTGCPETCKTLAEYSDHSSKYFINNAVFKFIQGTHHLPRSLNVSDIRNLSLGGYGVKSFSDVIIECQPAECSGIVFRSSAEIRIHHVTFRFCSVSFVKIANLHLISVAILNSSTFGLKVQSTNGQVDVKNSLIRYNSETNAIFSFMGCLLEDSILLAISESKFQDGNSGGFVSGASTAGGLVIECFCPGLSVILEAITATGNSGGNVMFTMHHFPWGVTVRHSTIEYGRGLIGAGMHFMSHWSSNNSTICNGSLSRSMLMITDTNFTSNVAEGTPGGLLIDLHDSRSMPYTVALMDCRFTRNGVKGHGGAAAMKIVGQSIPSYDQTLTSQFMVSLFQCYFSSNLARGSTGSVLDLRNVHKMLLQDCDFLHNVGTAISMVSSSMVFSGSICFQNNTSVNGGALRLVTFSVMFIEVETKVRFLGNRAERTGGAIFVDRATIDEPTPCFFQPNVKDNTSVADLAGIELHFVGNSATLAGDDIYGGDVGNCFTFSRLRDKNETESNYHSMLVYKTMFKMQTTSGYSTVPSDAYKISFCDSGRPILDPVKKVSIVPGETASIEVATMGQHLIMATALPHVGVTINQPLSYMSEKCQKLSISFVADSNFTTQTIEIVLKAQQSGPMMIPSRHPSNITVSLFVDKCPWGFILQGGSCHCFWAFGPCDLQERTVKIHSQKWFGCWNNGNETCRGKDIVNTSSTCEHYCNSSYSVVKNSTVDVQCAEGRTGMLCASCVENHSLVLGSGQCRVCRPSNVYLSLVPVYLAAGILLIVVVSKCGLTVNHGALNGLLLFANFVHLNRFHFFPRFKNYDIARLIIAWLNLDSGIEICFYDGMKALDMLWLQVGYILYILLLQVAVVFLCRKYTVFTRFFGRNITKVISTIFILLHCKVLRTVSDIFMYAKLMQIDNTGNVHNTSYFLAVDGTVHYGSHRHIPLLIIAAFLSVPLILFTFSLLFIQMLTRVSSYRCFKWVARFQPFFETITGPCNSYYAFWPGFLLLVRLVYKVWWISVGFNGRSLYALSAGVLLTIILSFLTPNGVYKNWALNITELSLFVNISISSILLQNRDGLAKYIISYLSVSIALLCFCGYHIRLDRKLKRARKVTIKYTRALKKYFRRKLRNQDSHPVVTRSVVTVSASSAHESSPLLPAQVMPPVINYSLLREPVIDSHCSSD